jgi:catechol 2,3-dioxygenase
MTIDPATTLGPVELVVGDLDAMTTFYEAAIGLRALGEERATARLGIEGDAPLLVLHGDADAPLRPRHSTGLYHFALAVPSRAELARAVYRVTGAGWSFTGASDHLVSEALYLNDPEGNGIEIYCDRPRSAWSYVDGALQMATLPLDLQGVLGEAPESGPGNGMAPGTRVGHVHLQVAEIPPTDAFYCEALGFEATARIVPDVLFVSAGGYHHHIGTNTWASRGAPLPPAGARGLRRFTIVLPDAAELARVTDAAAAAGVDVAQEEDGLVVTDPSGNRARLVSP